MTASEPKPSMIGFISVLEHNSDFYGGLLVLNTAGRPVEFHCTAPVKPTRSHQVLYGQTLASYVLADHIGPAMIGNVKSQPQLFCTDCIELTEIDAKIAEMVFVPPTQIGEVENAARGLDEDKRFRFEAGHALGTGPQFLKLLAMQVGNQVVGINQALQDSQQAISQRLLPFLEQIELSEPFERIHNAIRESHGIHKTETIPGQSEVRA